MGGPLNEMLTSNEKKEARRATKRKRPGRYRLVRTSDLRESQQRISLRETLLEHRLGETLLQMALHLTS